MSGPGNDQDLKVSLLLMMGKKHWEKCFKTPQACVSSILAPQISTTRDSFIWIIKDSLNR